MSALIHSPFECGALAGWLQVRPPPKPRLMDALSICSNCWRLRHTSSPTVPEMSIFSFTIGMKCHHKAAEIAPKTDLDQGAPIINHELLNPLRLLGMKPRQVD